jgi:hypothetical protein
MPADDITVAQWSYSPHDQLGVGGINNRYMIGACRLHYVIQERIDRNRSERRQARGNAPDIYQTLNRAVAVATVGAWEASTRAVPASQPRRGMELERVRRVVSDAELGDPRGRLCEILREPRRPKRETKPSMWGEVAEEASGTESGCHR